MVMASVPSVGQGRARVNSINGNSQVFLRLSRATRPKLSVSNEPFIVEKLAFLPSNPHEFAQRHCQWVKGSTTPSDRDTKTRKSKDVDISGDQHSAPASSSTSPSKEPLDALESVSIPTTLDELFTTPLPPESRSIRLLYQLHFEESLYDSVPHSAWTLLTA